MWKCVSASTTVIFVWFFLEAWKSGFGAQEFPLKTGVWESASSATTGEDLIKVRFWEYFLVAAVGLVAGLVGGLWVQINIRLTKLRRRLALSKPLKLLEVMFFTVLSKLLVLYTCWVFFMTVLTHLLSLHSRLSGMSDMVSAHRLHCLQG